MASLTSSKSNPFKPPTSPFSPKPPIGKTPKDWSEYVNKNVKPPTGGGGIGLYVSGGGGGGGGSGTGTTPPPFTSGGGGGSGTGTTPQVNPYTAQMQKQAQQMQQQAQAQQAYSKYIQQQALQSGVSFQVQLTREQAKRAENIRKGFEITSTGEKVIYDTKGNIAGVEANLGYGTKSYTIGEYNKEVARLQSVIPKTKYIQTSTGVITEQPKTKLTINEFTYLPEDTKQIYTEPTTGKPIYNITEYYQRNKIPLTKPTLPQFLESKKQPPTYDVAGLSTRKGQTIMEFKETGDVNKLQPTYLESGEVSSAEGYITTLALLPFGATKLALSGLPALTGKNLYSASSLLFSKPITQTQSKIMDIIPAQNGDWSASGITRGLVRGSIFVSTIPLTGKAYAYQFGKDLLSNPIETGKGFGEYAIRNPVEVGTVILSPYGKSVYKDVRLARKVGLSYGELKLTRDYLTLDLNQFEKKYGMLEEKEAYSILKEKVKTKAQDTSGYGLLDAKLVKGGLSFENIEKQRLKEFKKDLGGLPEYSKPASQAKTIFLKEQEMLRELALEQGIEAQRRADILRAKNPIKYANIPEDVTIRQAKLLLEKPIFYEYMDSLRPVKGVGVVGKELTIKQIKLNAEEPFKVFREERTDITSYGQEGKLQFDVVKRYIQEGLTGKKLRLSPEQYLDYLIKKGKLEFVETKRIKGGQAYGIQGKDILTNKKYIGILDKELLGEDLYRQVLRHELVHFGQPEWFKRISHKLPYKYRPNELLANTLGKKGFKVPEEKLMLKQSLKKYIFLEDVDLQHAFKEVLSDIRTFNEFGQGNYPRAKNFYESLTPEEVEAGLVGNVYVPKATTFTTRGQFKQLKAYRRGITIGEGAGATFIPFETRGRYYVTELLIERVKVGLAKQKGAMSGIGEIFEKTAYKYITPNKGVIDIIISKQDIQRALNKPLSRLKLTKEQFEREAIAPKLVRKIVPKQGWLDRTTGEYELTTLYKIPKNIRPRVNINKLGNFKEVGITEAEIFKKTSEFVDKKNIATKDILRKQKNILRELYGEGKLVKQEKAPSYFEIGLENQKQLIKVQNLFQGTSAIPTLKPALRQIRYSKPRQMNYNNLLKQDLPMLGLHKTNVNNLIGISPEINIGISPTIQPMINPTVRATINPLINPAINPTIQPMINPLIQPTIQPLIQPTIQPTINPTINATIRPLIFPRITERNIIEPYDMGRRKKQRIRKVPVYSAFIKRRGKFRPLGNDLTYGQALKIGERGLLTTLGRTAQIKQTGYKEMFDIDMQPEPNINLFRSYKVRQGKKIPLPKGTFIQRQRFALSSPQEKEEIRLARIMKGGLA